MSPPVKSGMLFASAGVGQRSISIDPPSLATVVDAKLEESMFSINYVDARKSPKRRLLHFQSGLAKDEDVVQCCSPAKVLAAG